MLSSYTTLSKKCNTICFLYYNGENRSRTCNGLKPRLRSQTVCLANSDLSMSGLGGTRTPTFSIKAPDLQSGSFTNLDTNPYSVISNQLSVIKTATRKHTDYCLLFTDNCLSGPPRNRTLIIPLKRRMHTHSANDPQNCPGRDRTCDHSLNRRLLLPLSYRALKVQTGLEPAIHQIESLIARPLRILHQVKRENSASCKFEKLFF